MSYPRGWIGETRQLILEDPFFLAGILGLEVQWFHRAWFFFCEDHPKHVLQAGRGFGKSTICTTVLVIWRLLRDPNLRVLIVSRTEGQASRAVREIRGHLERNILLQDLFGRFVGTGSWTDTSLVLAQRTAVQKEPSVIAMGLEGQIAGGHWELIIVDDPFDEDSSRTELMRDRAYEWLFTTLAPTMMPGGSIGFRCTRYHYGDLAGRIERELATDVKTGVCQVHRLEARDQILPIPRDAGWKVLQTPAIMADGTSLWEAAFPLEDTVKSDGAIVEGLKRKRIEMRERRFGEQFLMVCTEPPKRGQQETEFKLAWFKKWEAPPDGKRLTVFQFVDPAFRDKEQAAARTKRDRDPDFYAICVLGVDYGAGKSYVLDVFRDRLTPIERETVAKKYADRWHPKVLKIERTGLQIHEASSFYANILRALLPHRASFVQPSVNKVARAQPLARAMESGLVYWNPTIFADYPALEEEFVDFPFGLHDDLVDCVSGAFLLGERRPMIWASGDQRDYSSGPAPAGGGARVVPGGGGGEGQSAREVGNGGFYDGGGRAVPR